MSIKLMSAIWENGPDKQAERFVLLALADFANDTGECWPSIAGIAAKTCLSERGVRQIVRALEADGWLTTRVGGGRGGASIYTVNPEPRAPIDTHKPGTSCPPEPRAPRNETTETRHLTAQNPERGAPEPSGTIKNHQEQQPRVEVPSSQADATTRERLLVAMGADPISGLIGPNGRRLGTVADTVEAEKWSAMGISLDRQCAVIAERCAAMRKSNPNWTPGRFVYFTGAMADLAATRDAPVPPGQAKGQSDRDAKLARYSKIAGQAG